MYLERVKAKGKHYLYLRTYDSSITYSKNKKVTLYRFGRLDNAIEEIEEWRKDPGKLPQKLKELNCTRGDLVSWIDYLRNKTAKRTG